MDKKQQRELNRRPLGNSDLAKLPQNTLAKSMASLEDIMARHIGGEKLTEAEEALLDRVVSERTGKRVGKFAEKSAKTKFNGLVISADGGNKGQLEPRSIGMQPRKEPEVSSKVVTKTSAP